MSGEQFCLRWNNFQSSILSNLESLKCDEDLVDVTLMCEGKSVKAHKLVLSACSSYFKNVFKENPCSHPVVILKGFTFADISSLVSFMYQGEVHISQDKLGSFLGTAELLEVRGLADVPSPNVAVSELNKRSIEDREAIPRHCTSPKGLESSSSTPQNPSLPLQVINNQTYYEPPESVQPQRSPVHNQTDIKRLRSGESVTPTDSDNGEGEDIEEWKNDESEWKVIPKEEPMDSQGSDQPSLTDRIPPEETSQPFDWQTLSGSESSNQNLTAQNPDPRLLQNMDFHASVDAACQGASDEEGGDGIRRTAEQWKVLLRSDTLVVGGDYKKPHQCPLCHRMYSNYFNMKQHCTNVHFPGKVNCDLCSRSFKNKWYLRKHMVRRHGAPLIREATSRGRDGLSVKRRK